jgi:hypothetical protein
MVYYVSNIFPYALDIFWVLFYPYYQYSCAIYKGFKIKGHEAINLGGGKGSKRINNNNNKPFIFKQVGVG